MELWRRFAKSPSVYSAGLYGATGLGFAGGNLILAMILPARDFGLLTLTLSILSVAANIAPLGLDGLVNRRALQPTSGVLWNTVMASLLVALITSILSRVVYELDWTTIALTATGVFFGGICAVAAAVFQQRHQFLRSVLISQNTNVTLMIAALVALALQIRNVYFPLVSIVLGSWMVSLGVWLFLIQRNPAVPSARVGAWREALSYAGVSGAGLLMLQLERLLIPTVLSLEELAMFGVLAAIILAPYRMLQMGVGFSILPRLRACSTVSERRSLLKHELVTVGLLTGAGSAVLYLAVPPLIQLLYSGDYMPSRSLLLAALAAGVLRVAGGFSKGFTTALCTVSELGTLTIALWLSVGVAAVGTLVGSRFGLTGAVLGASVGWLLRTFISAFLVRRHLREAAVG